MNVNELTEKIWNRVIDGDTSGHSEAVQEIKSLLSAALDEAVEKAEDNFRMEKIQDSHCSADCSERCEEAKAVALAIQEKEHVEELKIVLDQLRETWVAKVAAAYHEGVLTTQKELAEWTQTRIKEVYEDCAEIVETAIPEPSCPVDAAMLGKAQSLIAAKIRAKAKDL